MHPTFHWLKTRMFCYSTENEDLMTECLENLVGENIEYEIAESEHGNRIVIFLSEMKKQKEFISLFSKLDDDLLKFIVDDIDNRIDDDCVFYLRLDKQDFVQGRFKVAHDGDVVSITGKVMSHPARKEIAKKNVLDFISSLRQQGTNP